MQQLKSIWRAQGPSSIGEMHGIWTAAARSREKIAGEQHRAILANRKKPALPQLVVTAVSVGTRGPVVSLAAPWLRHLRWLRAPADDEYGFLIATGSEDAVPISFCHTSY